MSVEPDQTQDAPEESESEGHERPDGTQAAPQMCCDGQKTAEAHRHESPDGKCCVD